MTKLDVAIELIIPDNTAHTVLTALRRLGYESLKKVERSDHFFLTLAEDALRPDEIIAQLMRAEVLFNPNKHRLSYAVVGSATGNRQALEHEALVADKDDNTDRLLKLLADTFGMASLRGIERAVSWRLYDEGGPASPQRLEWACRTLLSNPISQRFTIRPRPVRRQVGEPKLAVSKDPG